VRGKESGGVASPTCCAARSRSKSPSASGAERIRTPLSTVVAVLPRPEIGDTRVQKFPEIRIRGGAKNLG
jgi:hypothetical protein